jgi:hypothetical protein
MIKFYKNQLTLKQPFSYVLHSGTNPFILKSVVIYITVHHLDMYYYESFISMYESFIYMYNSISNGFYLPSFYFKPHDIHPLIKNTYDL